MAVSSKLSTHNPAKIAFPALGSHVSSVTTSLAFIPFPISTRPAAHEATSYLIKLILLAFFSVSLSLFFSSLANYEGLIVFLRRSADLRAHQRRFRGRLSFIFRDY
jgi:hypothetical protein